MSYTGINSDSGLKKRILEFDNFTDKKINTASQGLDRSARGDVASGLFTILNESLTNGPFPHASDFVYGLRIMAQLAGSKGCDGYRSFAGDSTKSLVDRFNGSSRRIQDRPIVHIHPLHYNFSTKRVETTTINFYGGSGETSSTWSPKIGGK